MIINKKILYYGNFRVVIEALFVAQCYQEKDILY